MMDEIYAEGEIWRFAVGMPSNQTFFYEGEIRKITDSLLVVFDFRKQAEMIIRKDKIITAERKVPPVEGGGRNG